MEQETQREQVHRDLTSTSYMIPRIFVCPYIISLPPSSSRLKLLMSPLLYQVMLREPRWHVPLLVL